MHHSPVAPLLALLLILLPPTGAAEGEDRAVLAATLAQQVAEQRDHARPTCVIAELTAPLAYARRRAETRRVVAQRDGSGPPPIVYVWRARSGPDGTAGLVAPELNERLNRLLAAALGRAPSSAGPPIDAALTPAPFQLGRTDRHCATLTLSTPAFVEDLAFVETAYVCGGLCGSGTLMALRRREEGWSVIAFLPTWIS